jgi:hypothetical protein
MPHREQAPYDLVQGGHASEQCDSARTPRKS